MMSGTIMGRTSSGSSQARMRPCPRTIAYDAIVPVTTDTTMAPMAMRALSHSADIQVGSAKNSLTQWNEKPGGGNCRNGDVLNARGMTTSTGAMRKIET